MTNLSDDTEITIPIRNLLALILAVAVSVTAYVNSTSRIASLENAQNIRDIEIKMNSEFRIKWPRGELGALPDDAEQNLRLMYVEDDLRDLNNIVRKIQIEGGIVE